MRRNYNDTQPHRRRQNPKSSPKQPCRRRFPSSLSGFFISPFSLRLPFWNTILPSFPLPSGPLAGILLTLATFLLQGRPVSAHSGVYGILMNILSTGTLVLAAGLCYRRRRTKPVALRCPFLGIAALVPVMLGANLLVTPLFMRGSERSSGASCPLLKAGVNSAVTFLLYQRVSPFPQR